MTWTFDRCNTATALYKVFLNEPLAQCAFSFRCWFSLNKTLSGRLQELKNKVQSWVIPKVSKVVAVRYESFSFFFFTKFKSAQVRTGLDRGGHNQSWSLTWSWVVARRSFRCFVNSVSVSWEAGKVKVKDTMDGFFGALVSRTSPSWIQLFISVLGCPVTVCIFNSIPCISFVSESKNKLNHLCLILRYW